MVALVLPMPVTPNTPLFGHSGYLDSLGLVVLIVLVEEKVFNDRGIVITLANERAMSEQHSPFRSVQSLTDFVDLLIKEQKND